MVEHVYYIKLVHREGNLSLNIQLALLNIYYLELFMGETTVDPPFFCGWPFAKDFLST